MVQFRYAALWTCILIICDTSSVLYYNFRLGPRIFKVKSVLIKETMKGIKSNIIGGKLLLNSGAKF